MPITPDVLRQHMNPVFIESGSFLGGGIMAAMQAGFPKIISIELSEHNYNICASQFMNDSQVKLYLGESEKCLPHILLGIDTRATFWLDAHFSGCADGWITAKGESNTAIKKELEAIKNHHINDHVIMIDDRRMFGTEDFDYITEKQLIDWIMAINKNYRISYGTGWSNLKDDILIARV